MAMTSNATPQFNFKGRRSPLTLTIVILVVLSGVLLSLSGFYADWLWFKSVDFTSVWTTVLTTKIFLFVVAGLLTSSIILLNIIIAYKRRPLYVPLSIEADNLERYRAQIEPIKRWVVLALAVGLFYFAGTSGSAMWESWLLFKNSTSFGVKDPQFNMDISFFAFKLPFYQTLIAWAISTLILSIIAAAVVHYLYGGIRLQVQEDRTTVAARVQLSVLLGGVVLMKAVAYWFDRYQLALKESKLITGLTYTDVNATLPAKAILAAIAVVCALLFFANIIRRSWVLPAAGTALLVVSSVLIAGIYPGAIQQFQVKPSESSKEAPFIQRNIDATRSAYGLDDVSISDYQATVATNTGQLADDAATIANIRLMDPNVLSATFRQLQQIRPYYSFPESLDIDRYTVDGVKRDVVIAVRELNIEGNPSRNWINDHLVYTHGFGLVAAYGNDRDIDGKPKFAVGNLPPTGALEKFEPRVYFGENVPNYSIIGGVKTDTPVEFDYPDDTSPNGQRNYTYTGTGGVPVGSLINKVIFALKYQEQRILLSNLINKDSKILFERNPRERVAKVAPWLTLDGDPYPALVDGKIMWIIDGFTTSAGYPYSRQSVLSNVIADIQGSATIGAQRNRTVNYIRNSVKATVDAYNGTVTLYEWNEKDPVLKTWAKAFPNTIKPKSEISAQLLEHIRYPEDLFRVQREILSSYHVKTAEAFYGGQDFWRVPRDPSTFGANASAQPPYYLTLQMPGTKKPVFSLTTPFVPLSLLRRGGSDVVLGNLLTLPVGGGLLYVQPVYVRATSNTAAYPLLQKVLVSFGDQIGYDDTLKGALDQVFGGNSGTVAGGSSSGTSGQISTNSSLANSLASAKQAYADGLAALAKGDFAAYDRAQKRLKSALDAAINAQNK